MNKLVLERQQLVKQILRTTGSKRHALLAKLANIDSALNNLK